VVGWIGWDEIWLQEGCGGVCIYQDVCVVLLFFHIFHVSLFVCEIA
jgi:hypothetical protein